MIASRGSTPFGFHKVIMQHALRIDVVSGLLKQAGAASLIGKGVKHLWNHGVWSGVANLATREAAKPGAVGAAARATAGAASFLAKPSVRSASLALIPASVLGIPGAQTLSNILTPGVAAAFATPNAITSARLTFGNHTAAIKADAMRGSQTAVADFLTVAQQAPESFSRAGQYKELLGKFGLNTENIGRYTSGQHAGSPTTWQSISGALSNPKEVATNYVRDALQKQVKQAGIGSLMRVGGKLLPLALTAPAVYRIGKSLLETKPYDAIAVEQEGYDATQAEVSTKVDGMGAVERMALRLDPTLAFGKVEDLAPGAIKNWEQTSGQTYKPGWLESMRKNWASGGTPNFYTYDINNNRSYLPAD